MLARITSFRLLASTALILITLLGRILSENVTGAPAPKSNPYALLYIPKKSSQSQTTRYRRRQIALFKTNSVPFVLFWAIRRLNDTDLPCLPKKGKGGENRFNNEEDIAWLAKHLQVEYLDGTGVLRISLSAGTSREQALLVNAAVNTYFRMEVDSHKQLREKSLEANRQRAKVYQGEFEVARGAHKKKMESRLVELKDEIRETEEELRTLPRLLELADVPSE